MRSSMLALFATLFLHTVVFDQQDTITGAISITGVACSPSGSMISGLDLIVSKGTDKLVFPTDANGNFNLKLRPGSYEVAVNKTFSDDFKLFLKIAEGNLNPQGFEIIVDPPKLGYGNKAGESSAKPVRLPKPQYPAAAIAVRAMGEVKVEIEIGVDGKVIAAKPINGYPLLQQSSVVAARSSQFDPPMNGKRELSLTYAYLGDIRESDVKQQNIRCSDPYRIEVFYRSELYY